MEKFKSAFGWDIDKTPIFDVHGNVINGYNQITRNDNNSSIAVMKSSYHPMTTAEFTDVVERVAGIIGADIAGYEDWANVGKKRSKNIITAQLRITKEVQIAGSRMDGFMTIGTGFDGNRSFYIGHTQEFLRCTNQFGRIIENFTSRLTKNNMIRVEDIVSKISLYEDYEKKLYENLEKMHSVKIDERVIQECVARLVGLTAEERLEPATISKQKVNKMDDIMSSLRSEMSELGQNALGLFNGVTHYTTHVMESGTNDYFGNIGGAKGKMNDVGFEFCLEQL
jgi:hypothetical protein